MTDFEWLLDQFREAGYQLDWRDGKWVSLSRAPQQETNTMKHTAGNWSYVRGEDAYLEIISPETEVATVFEQHDEAETWANARLIAAAPDMYEALKEIEQMPWPDSESPYALIARRALSKVEGG